MRKEIAITAAIVTSLFAGVSASSAMAASDATPGPVVTTVTSEDSVSPDARGFTHHRVEITQTRSGLTGGRLWDYTEIMNWDTNSGWVWNTTIQRVGHGSWTWDWEGTNETNHWGCDGCIYEGWMGQGHFQSNIRAPFLTENNYPKISVTGYGKRQSNGHFYTYSRSCGC